MLKIDFTSKIKIPENKRNFKKTYTFVNVALGLRTIVIGNLKQIAHTFLIIIFNYA